MEDPIDALCARLHRALRGEHPLDAADVAALACELLARGGDGPAVREAVERRPGDIPPAELSGLARELLTESGFEPGFDLAPELLETLRQALVPVVRDLRAHGLRDGARLVVQDGWFPPSAGVVLGDAWLHGGGLPASCGRDPATAVAAHVQESLMERDRRVRPVCPAHRLGLHAAVAPSGTAVWACSAGGGHHVAAIGDL
ncbi:hypothetical protein [Kitasatospora sp. KL5]|uniref:hypothetical protein n=1 Tax=Kitasatospora sp. KL5 TaxID=3425125 RepID=UPI003D6DBA51